MFQIDDDMTIYITRGDVAFFTVTAENNGEKHKFQPGDVVRIKVFAKKDATNVAFQKDFPVLEESEKVDILLTEAETKIGDVISKPVDYWYEIELNPYSNPQTIVGYDDDGAKIFKLFPEGRDLGPDTVPEDVPVVDTELSLTSQKPVENQAVTRAIVKLSEDVKNEVENHAETLAKMEAEVDEALNKAYTETDRVSHELAIERARINNLVANAGDTDNNAELIDIRTGADGTIYETAGEAVRGQVANLTNTTEFLKDVDGILKCATGLEEKKDVKLSFLGLYSGKTRAKTDFFGTTYATHISIAEVAGYQTSVFYYTGDNYVSSPWNTKIDRLDISGCDKAYVAYRKSDDSALTDADANNIQSAMKAFLFYDGGLKSDLSELENEVEGMFNEVWSPNVFNPVNVGKYLHTNGNLLDNALYTTSDYIPVNTGNVIRMQATLKNNNSRYDAELKPAYMDINYICGYDADKNMVNSRVGSVTTYTVPEGVSYVRATVVNEETSTTLKDIALLISNSSTVLPFEPYGIISKTIKDEYIPTFNANENGVITNNNTGTSVSIEVPQLKKNTTISFFGTFDTFDDLYIYQGKGTGWTECYCKITNTLLEIYRNGSTSPNFSVAHGLTMSDYISVVISISRNNAVKVYVDSGGNTYTSENTLWNGSRGTITAEHNSSWVNNLSWGSGDVLERVWLYGDSYFDHWLPVMINRGYTAFLDDGFSGATSAYGVESFKQALELGCPSKVVWCLGMNDADNGAINASWLASINEVKDICNEKGIELIVTTIPNVPERNHTYKNTYIKANFDYIDIAEYVGSNATTSWYNGLLSSDNVHPSANGDFFIANIMMMYLSDLRRD